MNLATLKDKLLKDDLTLIAHLENDQLYTSFLRGIKPVLNKMQEQPNFFQQAIIVDKVVGKAVAMLFIKAGVKHIYALTISEKAIAVLDANKISYEYDKKCEYIENRTHTGMCPMEETVQNIDDIEEAYLALINKVKELTIQGETKWKN